MRGTSLWEMSNKCFTIPMLLSPFIAPIHLSTTFVCYQRKKKYGFFGSVENNDFLLHSYCNNIVYSYIFKLNNVGDFEKKKNLKDNYNMLLTPQLEPFPSLEPPSTLCMRRCQFSYKIFGG